VLPAVDSFARGRAPEPRRYNDTRL